MGPCTLSSSFPSSQASHRAPSIITMRSGSSSRPVWARMAIVTTGRSAVLRLQQILFYRELGMPLDDIKKIMGRRDFDVLGALHSHKEALQKQVTRLNRLITTVDNTIHHLKGTTIMSEKGLFEGFSEEQQEEYAAEAEKMYDPETVRESNRKWKAYSASKERIHPGGRQGHLHRYDRRHAQGSRQSLRPRPSSSAGASTWTTSGPRIWTSSRPWPTATTTTRASRRTSTKCTRSWQSSCGRRSGCMWKIKGNKERERSNRPLLHGTACLSSVDRTITGRQGPRPAERRRRIAEL